MKEKLIVNTITKRISPTQINVEYHIGNAGIEELAFYGADIDITTTITDAIASKLQEAKEALMVAIEAEMPDCYEI